MTSKNNSENELAENRTKWAEDRTLHANERTFSTGLGQALDRYCQSKILKTFRVVRTAAENLKK